jgi:hypothetical protein
VSESLVSRDERNEYHGITVERAQRILDALNETVTAQVEEPARGAGSARARRPRLNGDLPTSTTGQSTMIGKL